MRPTHIDVFFMCFDFLQCTSGWSTRKRSGVVELKMFNSFKETILLTLFSSSGVLLEPGGTPLWISLASTNRLA